MSESNEKIRETVRQEYTKIAQSSSGCCGSSSPDKLAEGIGYTGEDLEVLPEGAKIEDYVASVDITAMKE